MSMATEHLSDEDILQEIQAGSHTAFSELVSRHTTRFYHLAYRYLASKEEAEDIVQTAFLKIWENPFIWKKGGKATFTTWFSRIVINLCLDQKKKFKASLMPENMDMQDDKPSQEQNILAQEKKSFVMAAINTLPDRQKTALILCFYEDYSQKEAAQIMKVKIKALESLLMRAKKGLKDQMKAYKI